MIRIEARKVHLSGSRLQFSMEAYQKREGIGEPFLRVYYSTYMWFHLARQKSAQRYSKAKWIELVDTHVAMKSTLSLSCHSPVCRPYLKFRKGNY